MGKRERKPDSNWESKKRSWSKPLPEVDYLRLRVSYYEAKENYERAWRVYTVAVLENKREHELRGYRDDIFEAKAAYDNAAAVLSKATLRQQKTGGKT